MSAKKFVTLTTLLVLIFGGTIVALQKHNRGLREEIAGMSGPGKRAVQLQEDNRRLARLVEQTKQDDASAGQIMAAELRDARGELAEVTRRRAHETKEKLLGAEKKEAVLAANRDPEKGPVRMENLQNLGRGTPASAFQTLGWAAMKGEDDVLAGAVLLERNERAQLQELLAGFSPEARARYQTPEKLVALFIAGDILKKATAEIVEQIAEAPDRVGLMVRVGDKPQAVRLPMQRTGDGWRMAISPGQVQKLIERLRDAPPDRK
jgi:hypothetical protein